MFVAKDAPRVAIISVAAFEMPVIPARRTHTLDLPHFLISPISGWWHKRGHYATSCERVADRGSLLAAQHVTDFGGARAWKWLG
jgi:hypothetical protein